MLRNTVSGLALCLGMALSIFLLPEPARAADITLQGAIATDDAVELFNLTVGGAGSVDIRSYGYAGGTTSTGTVVPRGGFDTILTLFSASGVFIDDNDEGAGAAADPATGLASDARISANLAAGGYILALTQYDNFSLGNPAGGFTETGNPNFTADPTFTTGGACPGNMFRDLSGTAGRCRTGNWALDFVNVASVTPAPPVPEPGTLALFGTGLLGFALLLGRKRRAAIAVPVLLAAIFSAGARAQAPDYSNVDDFLNGKRTLLSIEDVVIAGTAPPAANGTVELNSFTLTSTNSQLNPPTTINSAPIFPQNVKVLKGHVVNSTSFTPLELLSGTNNGYAGVYFPTLGVSAAIPGVLPPNEQLSKAAGIVADFNQDGLDEVVLNYANGTTVVGYRYPPTLLAYGPPSTLDALTDMAVGDFNGDGRPDIAGLVVLPSGQLELVIYTVDPKTLVISKAAQITLQKTLTYEVGQNVSITAGRFASAVHDQIVVANSGFLRTDPNGGEWNSRLELIDFPPSSLMPQEATTRDYLAVSPYGIVKVKTGRFGLPANLYQQIVVASLPQQADVPVVNLFSIDPTTLAWTYRGNYGLNAFDPNKQCAYDVAVGNFDFLQPDPANPGQTEHNLNDQIALLRGACGAGTPRGIDIIQPMAKAPFLGLASSTNLPSTFNNLASLTITQSDTQGRSLLLGQPTKITVSKPVQPSVVIGAPPMHVDWVSPDPLDGIAPEVLNLSAVPDGFNTTYDVENTTEQQSGTTNATSWSYGTKTTVGGYVQFGDPNVAEIKVSDMSTAAQELKSTAEQGQGSYTRNTYNIYQATGFGDQVSYDESNFNIWVYPVIGQTVCPAPTPAAPNCSQKVPLTIQFSAPNGDAVTQQAQGQSIQWYQPPWEPGNIFSYPANFDQLQNIYPNLAKLTKDGAEFITDSSTETQKTTWAVGTNATQTTSVEQNYSYENDFSSEASFSFLDLGGGVNVGYDVSGSSGLSNLTKSTSDLGTSTGIGIKKPGTFPDFTNYGYSVSPYVMGTVKPGGLVDDQPLNTDVRTFGSIRGLFTADPLTSNSGGWWQQAYSQAPDVALNHPSRWHIGFQGLTNPVPPSCLTTGTGASQMDCAELNQRTPRNPWLSSFHQMRGFFISNANSPGQGPQLEQAKAGDVLTLQARVYNYSLVAMPDGSKVHVRFYFQPWKGTIPVGNSVLIGETEIDPIHPFSDVTNASANWALASTTFDTGKYDQTKNGDVYVAFWVVVWIQGADMKMVGEMPDHGLTGIPGTLESLADAAQLEQIASDKNSYDNNVGFYKFAFYIANANDGAGATPPGARGLIDIGKLDVSARRFTPHETIEVSGTLSTSGAPISGVSATFYDGDPQEGGRVFGVERIPYIAADTSYDIATTYRTNACGTHQLFVVLNKGRAGEIVRRAPPVRLDCKARQ